MKFSFVWQKIWFDLVMAQDSVNITAYHKGDKVVPIEVFGKVYELKPGMTVEAKRPKKKK